VDGSHAIGVDLGGTKILAGVVTRDGEVLRRHERATPRDSQDSVVRELEAAVAELLDETVRPVCSA
jgi:glucokinase